MTDVESSFVEVTMVESIPRHQALGRNFQREVDIEAGFRQGAQHETTRHIKAIILRFISNYIQIARGGQVPFVTKQAPDSLNALLHGQIHIGIL